MDGLNDDQRALAWASTWHPSFAGKAIVNADGTFRSVNNQFCELLGVSPGELIGKRFQDITPPGIREVDEMNAKLAMDGLIDSYMLPKKYLFASGRTVNVMLMVHAVRNASREFLFFVSQIVLDKQDGALAMESRPESRSNSLPSFPDLAKDLMLFVKTYGKFFAAIGISLAAFVAAVLGGEATH